MEGEILGDIANVVMGQSPPGETCNETGVGLPLLNGPTEFGSHHPTAVQFTTDPRKRARTGDLLFCVRGSTTGRMNWADREYAIGRGIAAIRHRKGDDYQPFLRAAVEFRLPELLAQATGSTFPNVSFSQLSNLPCVSLDDGQQRGIAHILGTLDDKIELNRQTNETLEAMARALFKSWFVDFDPVRSKAEGNAPALPKDTSHLFPTSFEKSERGQIPKGWQIKPFASTVEIIGGGTPKTSVLEYWNGDIPWFSVVDAPNEADVWAVDTEKKITRAGLENSSTRILPEGTTIVTARGTVGKTALVGIPMAMNQSCYGLRSKETTRDFFTYFQTRELVSSFQRHSHGSIFDTITRDTLAGVSVVVPPEPVVKAFEGWLHSVLDRIRAALFESRTLSLVRDALLPKLISGELRIKDAERIVGSHV